MRLGVLDSDLGGLALARKLHQRLPQWEVMVAADTAQGPLGKRSAQAIGQMAERGANSLIRAGARMIVIACPILASIAGERLATTLEVPVFSICEAAVSAAAAISRKKRFGVMAAPATVESRFFEEALGRRCPEAVVVAVATPLLSDLVAEGWLKKPVTAMIVKTYLRPLKNRQIDTLILGCPHLNLLQKTLSRKAGARTRLVTGETLLIERIVQAAEQAAATDGPTDRPGGLRVCVTEKTRHLERSAREAFNGPVVLEPLVDKLLFPEEGKII